METPTPSTGRFTAYGKIFGALGFLIAAVVGVLRTAPRVDDFDMAEFLGVVLAEAIVMPAIVGVFCLAVGEVVGMFLRPIINWLRYR